jgi:UDP-N-acetyl-D-mannosaminuronic acid dehydrogenase
MMKRICVIGQGYIGIPTAMVLADQHFEVIGVDNDPKKIELLQNKKLPFHEAEFSEFAERVFKDKYYTFSTQVVSADVFLICVPTPFKPDKSCNFTYVNGAAESIAPVLKKGNLVILESTVPPKTCEEVLIPILNKSGLKPGDDYYVSHAPERLIPGNMLHEIIHNDRIIGGINEKSTKMTVELYRSFSKGQILETDAVTAEMCKLMENTYRDINIALANEFALICERLKINTYKAIEMANHHPRVNILTPGPGVGGHCIPKDPWYIYAKAPDLCRLIVQSRNINDEMPKIVANKVKEMIKGIKNPVVTILGVAYKQDVDDSRESPSEFIMEELKKDGITVRFCDPLVKFFGHSLIPLDESIKGSDCIIYAVNHSIFKEIDASLAAKSMRTKKIFIAGEFGDLNKWLNEKFDVHVLGKDEKYFGR